MSPSRAREIASLIHIVSGILYGAMARRAGEMGLSRNEYMVMRGMRLAHLFEEHADAKYLAARVNIPPRQVEPVARGLSDRGLLDLGEPSGPWTLTPEGRRLVGSLDSIQESLLVHMTSGLTSEEMEAFISLLERLNHS